MAIFTVLSLEEDPNLETEIKSLFVDACYKISALSWFVSFNGTSYELADKLGLLENSTLKRAVITRVESYHGRAPNPVWEWLKTKWDAASNA